MTGRTLGDIQAAIQTHRFHDFTIKLQGPNVRASERVSLQQMRHAFLFGANAFWLTRPQPPDVRQQHEDLFLGLFNAATLPFYWGRYEPREGEPDEENLKRAARWCRDHGLATKGHPLCWHTVCADWLLKYDDQTIVQKQMDRITRDVTAFRGLINTWDVINEVVIMPVFDKYDNAVTRIANYLGPVELTVRAFERAREANHAATLLINDFDLSPAYEALIEKLLARDCPIDVIGLQTHQHTGVLGVDRLADVIDRFSRFGLPLHFTETTILSGHLVPDTIEDLNDYQVVDWPSTPEGEARQLEQVERYYSYIYSRPEVEAIIWWDMVDGHWLNAPSGLVRDDLTPKPAYERLRELIRGAWWFPGTEVDLPEDAALRVRAPEGDYMLTVGDKKVPVTLSKETPVTVVGLDTVTP
ncbi:MAG: endo-1,4-beta-xylanase [Anaerolineae bacterium]